jgi:hypothetical protein
MSNMQPTPPVVIITCRVLVSALERLLPADLAEQVTVLDYGLHRVPVKLTDGVQEAIDAVETPSLIMLGYGLCGNGLRGIQSREHTLLIPRTDDCIAILLGSYRAYMRRFQAEPGTYYLTKGWLESGSDPLREYREYSARWDETTAMWLMDQQYSHYKRVALRRAECRRDGAVSRAGARSGPLLRTLGHDLRGSARLRRIRRGAGRRDDRAARHRRAAREAGVRLSVSSRRALK